MRPRHRSLRSLESRQAGRSKNPADAGPDPGRDERQHGRRRKIRPGMAGARATDDVVTDRQSSDLRLAMMFSLCSIWSFFGGDQMDVEKQREIIRLWNNMRRVEGPVAEEIRIQILECF